MNKSDWKVVLASVRQGSCVALVGPGLPAMSASGELRNIAITLSRQLAAEIAEADSDKQLEIHDPDNLPLVAQSYAECFSIEVLRDEATRYYRKCRTDLEASNKEDPAFKCLTALPLPLFVSIRSDDMLEHHLRKNGKEPVVKHYDFTGGEQKTIGDVGSVDKPLVYRLLGIASEPSTLPLTETNLLQLLKNLMSGDPELPNDLRSTFRERNFVFLGCGLASYYMRVLLHALGLNSSEKVSFAPEFLSASDANPDLRKNVWFYKVGYKKLKLLDIEERAFIQELYKQWNEHGGGEVLSAPANGEAAEAVMDGPEVFISYVREDEDRAIRIREILSRKGVTSWRDNDRLRSGDRWDNSIADAIKQSDFFIVLLSENLADGVDTYVHKEIQIALERRDRKGTNIRFILPLRIDAEASLLDSLSRANIHAPQLQEIESDVMHLASDIKKEFLRLRRR